MLNDEIASRRNFMSAVQIPTQGTADDVVRVEVPPAPVPAPAPAPPPVAVPRSVPGFPAWLVVVDGAAVLAAHLLTGPALGVPVWVAASLAGVLLLTLNAASGQYRPLVAPSLLDELPGLTGRTLVAWAVATTLLLALDRPVDAVGVVILLGTACLGRAVGYAVLRRWRATHRSGRPTIVVGNGRVGDQVATALLERPEYGMYPIGLVDDDITRGAQASRIPLLGGIDALPRLVHQYPCCDVVVADTSCREARLVDALRRCDRHAGEIFLVPRLHELHGADPGPAVRGFPLTRLRRASHRTVSWRLKRVCDVVAAGLGLVVLSPVLAVCAIAVYLEGGPGVIFRQERVGLDGRRFVILKFRSLTPVDVTESEERWSIQADPRLGPVGRTLRTLSLDELPQLWNVVRGDMSLVGPRPERPYFVKEFSRSIPHYGARHRVPAGLTGWAQVSGLRGDTDIAERARFDNYYIDNWSMWTDVKIALRTVGQLFTGRGQ